MHPSASALAREVVCAGFHGTSAADAPIEEMRQLGLRATILFARNVTGAAQVAALAGTLRDALGDDDPPLVAIDQEGGQVARIRDGVTALPAMMAVGATRDPALANRAGFALGADLARLGITLDFAPVLDLALEPRNTVIGARAFGEDPQLVAELGIAFAQGLAGAGIVPVVKHFPGHGATVVDSHFALPVLDLDEATWRSRELVPFARAMAAGLPAIMTAHVVLPAFDPQMPATLSRAIIGRLLREELRFDGVVFSDCLEMDAIAKGSGTAAAAPLALAAGVDCVVISHRLEAARDAIAAIEAAVRDGTLALARLEEAAARMRRLRASVGRSPERAAEPETGLEIARRAVTVLRGSIALARGSAVSVISFEQDEPASLSSALRRRRLKSEIMRVGLDPSEEDSALLEMVLRVLSARPVVILARRAHLHPQQVRAIERILETAPNAVVISAREPYDAALFPQAHNVACIYDDGQASLEGLADTMTGRAVPAGTLPVRLDAAAALR